MGEAGAAGCCTLGCCFISARAITARNKVLRTNSLIVLVLLAANRVTKQRQRLAEACVVNFVGRRIHRSDVPSMLIPLTT